MNKLYKAIIMLFTLFSFLQANSSELKPINFSMVISGGVSLGAYEAGYNWAIIKMLSEIKTKNSKLNPILSSVSGASAGSINALLSAMYWCQKESEPYHNGVADNLLNLGTSRYRRPYDKGQRPRKQEYSLHEKRACKKSSKDNESSRKTYL